MRYLTIVVIVVAILALGLVSLIYFKNKKPKTDHKHNQNTIGGDQAQLATIFSSIEDGLVLVDNKGTIVLLNPAAGNITGWQVSDAVGINVEVVIKLSDDHGNLYSGNDYPFTKVFTSGQTLRDDTSELITRDNQKLAVDLSISPLKDNAGNVSGAVGLIRNVSAQKQQENRLADFISTASHEMRTPVAAIEGYLSLALNSKVATVDDKARDYLEKAEAATKHLGVLFQDLLTSAKAEDGRLISHPEVIEFGEYLRGLSDDLKFAAEKHGLASEFVIGSASSANTTLPQAGERQVAPLYYTYVDPDRMREVITNLYDNAVKYTAQGKVTIGLTGDDQVVQFYVRDTGSGIPAEDMPHLFQKFYRVDNSATRTIGGTGLGLFICRKIVELYNGRIWVDSEVGKGSTFYINLPRISTQKATELLENKTSPTNITPTTAAGTPT